MPRMPKRQPFQVRLPESMWRFLRHEAYEQDISMNEIINILLEQYKSRKNKILTLPE